MANRKKTAGVQCSLVWKVTSIVLALTLVAGAVLATFEFGTPYKPSNGFRPTVQTPVQPDEEENPTASAGGAILGEAEGRGIKLTSETIARENYAAAGISESAKTAYTLTATVEPTNATYKGVTWSAAWVNGSSEWTNGKTLSDYLTLEAKGNSATVTCLQAFGEPIVITAVSEYDEGISATCRCDYLKSVTRVSAPKIYAMKEGDTGPREVNGFIATYGEGNKIGHFLLRSGIKEEYGEGTVTGKMKYTPELQVRHDAEFLSHLQIKGVIPSTKSNASEISFPIRLDMPFYSGQFYYINETYFDTLINSLCTSGLTSSGKENFKKKFRAAANTYTGESHYSVYVHYEYTYEDETYATGDSDALVAKYDVSRLAVETTNLTMNKDNVIFYGVS